MKNTSTRSVLTVSEQYFYQVRTNCVLNNTSTRSVLTVLWTILLSSCALNNTSNRTVLTVLWTILLSSQYNNYCLPSFYSSSMVLKYINIRYSYHQGTRTLFPPPLSYVIFTKDRPTISVQSVIFSISLFTYLSLVLFFSPRSFKIWTFLTKNTLTELKTTSWFEPRTAATECSRYHLATIYCTFPRKAYYG